MLVLLVGTEHRLRLRHTSTGVHVHTAMHTAMHTAVYTSYYLGMYTAVVAVLEYGRTKFSTRYV